MKRWYRKHKVQLMLAIAIITSSLGLVLCLKFVSEGLPERVRELGKAWRGEK